MCVAVLATVLVVVVVCVEACMNMLHDCVCVYQCSCLCVCVCVARTSQFSLLRGVKRVSELLILFDRQVTERGGGKKMRGGKVGKN